MKISKSKLVAILFLAIFVTVSINAATHTKAAIKSTNTYSYYYNTAVNYQKKKSYFVAISYYTKALSKNSKSYSAYYNRAVCHYLTKHYSSAIKDLNYSIKYWSLKNFVTLNILTLKNLN